MSRDATQGQLLLVCTHDGRGSIRCQTTLRKPEPPEWSFTAVLVFGGGAHAERLASDLEAFVRSRSCCPTPGGMGRSRDGRIGVSLLDEGDLDVGVDGGEAGEFRLITGKDHATSCLDGRSHHVSIGEV